MLEDGYNKDGRLSMDDENSRAVESLKQANMGKPPRHLSVIRHCMSSARLATASELDSDVDDDGPKSQASGSSGYFPVFRSGSCSDIGPKKYMEDEHICIDNLPEHLGESLDFPSTSAFYGVFDGHGGSDAASFVRKNILQFIMEDKYFPNCVQKAMKSAFVRADHAFADKQNLDRSSGTTALTALILGRINGAE